MGPLTCPKWGSVSDSVSDRVRRWKVLPRFEKEFDSDAHVRGWHLYHYSVKRGMEPLNGSGDLKHRERRNRSAGLRRTATIAAIAAIAVLMMTGRTGIPAGTAGQSTSTAPHPASSGAGNCPNVVYSGSGNQLSFQAVISCAIQAGFGDALQGGSDALVITVVAMLWQESNYNPNIVGIGNAMGLWQEGTAGQGSNGLPPPGCNNNACTSGPLSGYYDPTSCTTWNGAWSSIYNNPFCSSQLAFGQFQYYNATYPGQGLYKFWGAYQTGAYCQYSPAGFTGWGMVGCSGNNQNKKQFFWSTYCPNNHCRVLGNFSSFSKIGCQNKWTCPDGYMFKLSFGGGIVSGLEYTYDVTPGTGSVVTSTITDGSGNPIGSSICYNNDPSCTNPSTGYDPGNDGDQGFQCDEGTGWCSLYDPGVGLDTGYGGYCYTAYCLLDPGGDYSIGGGGGGGDGGGCNQVGNNTTGNNTTAAASPAFVGSGAAFVAPALSGGATPDQTGIAPAELYEC
jgi:hypothetical protein